MQVVRSGRECLGNNRGSSGEADGVGNDSQRDSIFKKVKCLGPVSFLIRVIVAEMRNTEGTEVRVREEGWLK